MPKVTPEEHADFVITMMNRDLEHGRMDLKEKVDYLVRIVDRATEFLVEERAKVEARANLPPVGEDRPEFEPSDIPIGLGVGDLLRALLPSSVVIGVNGVEELDSIKDFIRQHECLEGADARAWLYRNKIPKDYDHIHVMPNDMCMGFIGAGFPGDGVVEWVEPEGVRMRGDVIDVVIAMHKEWKHAAG